MCCDWQRSSLLMVATGRISDKAFFPFRYNGTLLLPEWAYPVSVLDKRARERRSERQPNAESEK